MRRLRSAIGVTLLTELLMVSTLLLTLQSSLIEAYGNNLMVFQKGMSYATYANMTSEVYSSAESNESLKRMNQIGVEWVAINVVWFQEKYTSTQILADSLKTSSNVSVACAIEAAHKQNMKVMLKPMIDLSNETEPVPWRGKIEPSTIWFQNYANFISFFAEFAEQNNVEMLCIGTELKKTVSWETEWRSIVSDIRELYSGPLTYAAALGEYEIIKWWDALDFVGINAYFPLSSKNNPTVAEMKATWDLVIKYLDFFHSKVMKPIIFTEIGYLSTDGTNKAPFDFTLQSAPGRIIDLQEQTDCYEATFQTVWRKNWLYGFYWWYWQPNPEAGGSGNSDYTPQNKPAQGVLMHWYLQNRQLDTILTLKLEKENITVGDSVIFTANLSDEDGQPIPNVDVDFDLLNQSETSVGSSKTNDTGVATFTFQPNKTGVLSFKAEFNGTQDYSASLSDSALLIVRKVGTTLSLELDKDNIAKGESVTLTAELIDENNQPVSDADVDFYLLEDGSQFKVGSSKTDSAGIATLTLPQNRADIFQFQAKFNTTQKYEASISNSKVLNVKGAFLNFDLQHVLILISLLAIVEAIIICVLLVKVKSLSKRFPKG